MAEELTPKQQAKLEKKRLKEENKRKKKLAKWEKQRRLLFPADKHGRHIMRSMNFFRFLFYPIHSFFFPFKLYGNKKVADGPCIYVGNHFTMLDMFYPAHTTTEGIHFMVKQSVMEAPVVGRWGRMIGAIGVLRDGSDVRSVMEAIKVLKNGEKLCIFPEGTRNRGAEDTFLPFRSGSAMLAIKTKTPVVPFVLCSRPRIFKRIHVVFGEPMSLEEYYDRRLTQEELAEADAKIEARMYAIRKEHFAFLEEKKRKKKCK